MNKLFLPVIALTFSAAATQAADLLIKLKSGQKPQSFEKDYGGKLTLVSKEGRLYEWTGDEASLDAVTDDSRVDFIEKNGSIGLFPNPTIEDNKEAIEEAVRRGGFSDITSSRSKPDFKTPTSNKTGTDPLLSRAWGMAKIGAPEAWKKSPQGKDIVVAVTDTGVDYNHEDLIRNMWRNPREVPNNGVDDDRNGYIDDLVGWDFTANDNRPFDVSGSAIQVLLAGANPGHGTHVAGVIGAALNNAVGFSGVAPKVKIMALRFLTEKGHGTTAGAVKAIDYAVKNGAKIINASWGSQGEDKGDSALKEAIQRAQQKGVLFIAAAGNGRPGPGGKSKGYNNDTDSKPSYPASYPFDNIISVAALDSIDELAPFSNYGKRTVHLGAPGVKILSTTPGSKYQDTISALLGFIKVTWDGTSMATPFVAGAAAALWSENPTKNWRDIKSSILNGTKKFGNLNGKVATGGSLDLRRLPF